MINIRDILPRYFDILEENRIAKYIQCKYVPVRFSKTESIKSLWEKHGAVATGKDLLEAFDFIDVANKGTIIFLKCLSCKLLVSILK